MDYRYNNLNQLVEQSDDGWKTYTTSSYDNRGNLILETYHKGNKSSVTGAYTYDETNKMVLGVNDLGEESIYTYNGLGALMENTWVVKKNGLIDPATGKYSEKLRIDPPTPTGKKGPEYSHYHLDGGKEHLSPNPKDNDPWK